MTEHESSEETVQTFVQCVTCRYRKITELCKGIIFEFSVQITDLIHKKNNQKKYE